MSIAEVPATALTHAQMARYAERLGIPHFRGVFMRERLPRRGPRARECAVINLDAVEGEGTHFVAYAKRGRNVKYFDSFGLQPPPEFFDYLSRAATNTAFDVKYNQSQVQRNEASDCGRLCLSFLVREWKT